MARGLQLAREFGVEVRNARLASGLSQTAVGMAIGVSKSTVSRVEHATPPLPDVVLASQLARVVGLDLSVRCFPAAGRLRDAGHARVIGRFLARVALDVPRELESPVRPGDLRAWDVLLTLRGETVGVAAETHLRDLQALLRREQRKQLDGGVHRLLLLVADTKHNRAAMADASALLHQHFPLSTRAVLARLSRGEALGANGLVLL